VKPAKDFNDLGEELYHVFMSTKGARFNSHRRLLSKSNLSNLTVSLLTAYVIIINLLGLVRINGTTPLNTDFVSLLTTALSILILVFSQIEASYEYKLKAEKYHDCAKEIGELYYELRDIQHKTAEAKDKEEKFSDLRKRYSEIISRYDNHSNIDYFRFMLQRPTDFNLTTLTKIKFYINEYVATKLIYHVLIVLPVIIFFVYIS
jgi:hypothetical protein